jgi:hypothetical protein
MDNQELIKKEVKVRKLFFFELNFPPMLVQFFDLNSDSLLDEKSKFWKRRRKTDF